MAFGIGCNVYNICGNYRNYPYRTVLYNKQQCGADKLGNVGFQKTPAARWGDPEDLMGPAVFLASDASNFVNGHVLYVDGGILAYIGKQP